MRFIAWGVAPPPKPPEATRGRGSRSTLSAPALRGCPSTRQSNGVQRSETRPPKLAKRRAWATPKNTECNEASEVRRSRTECSLSHRAPRFFGERSETKKGGYGADVWGLPTREARGAPRGRTPLGVRPLEVSRRLAVRATKSRQVGRPAPPIKGCGPSRRAAGEPLMVHDRRRREQHRCARRYAAEIRHREASNGWRSMRRSGVAHLAGAFVQDG